MSTTAFDIYTATPGEMAAAIDAKFRELHLNFSDKLEWLSDLKFSLTSDGQLMHNVIDFDQQGRCRTPEGIAAHRRYTGLEVAWLEANPGDDLTPDEIARHVKWARDAMPHAQELRIAVNWCKEVEEWHESEPDKKSETLRALERKLGDATDEVRRHLRSAITMAQSDFLAEVNARSHRFKRRFRLERTNRSYLELHRYRLIDFAQTEHRRRLLHASFSRSVEHAATLKEVKAICAAWHAECKVEIRDGASFVVGDGFEAVPQ